jgi:uncharacterized membrane protein
VLGLLNPGYEPSLDIEAQGNPDLLDLGIAFASGMVAAYAQGPPNVASTLAGVAGAGAGAEGEGGGRSRAGACAAVG